MKSVMLKFLSILALSLAVAGCSSLSGKSDGASGDGAPVDEVGAGGAATAGASQQGAWAGNPLDDPASLVSIRVIYFDYDASEVREDYRDVVIAHGAYLAANPTVTLTVEGHADERGSREYNIALGERRANAVKNLLLAQGAHAGQIVTVSYGEERPLEMGSDESAWAQNRRAELVY